jgi:beta-lactamase regulating signal transducer with metallopeptidase domain
MITYLIKSTLSIVLFFLFYKLVLEREKMHHINRFMLLFALVFSIVIPFISFEFISQNPVIIQSLPSYIIPEISIGNPTVETSTIFTTKNILWLLYGLGFSLFLSRFIKNLASLLRSIHESEKIKYDGFTLVLITEKILPHSFWNYVFINRDEYKNNQVTKELFVHEKAHITQKHSLDILFIEALQILFWFNPLIYLYKKAIKLNHEFLADQKVNETFKEVVQYQKLLLQKAVGNLVPIASNLNYSITKKRFVMMTKNQSKLMTISKVSFSLLLFGAIFFTFSVEAQEKDFNEETLEALYDRFYKEYPEYFDPETKKPLEDKLTLEIKTDSIGKKSLVVQFKDKNSKAIDEQEQVYTKPETRPEFEGGIQAFYEYVKKNLKMPKVENDVKGNVIVAFVVEKDGSLSNIKILRDPVGMEKEVTEMLTACPKWKPGMQDGKPVRVEYTLPIAVSIKAAKK